MTHHENATLSESVTLPSPQVSQIFSLKHVILTIRKNLRGVTVHEEINQNNLYEIQREKNELK